jgi:hypothetical protein
LFSADQARYYRFEIELELRGGLNGNAQILFYDRARRLIRSPHRRTLRPGTNLVRLSFRPTPSSSSFTFGLSFNERADGECLLSSVRLLAFSEE